MNYWKKILFIISFLLAVSFLVDIPISYAASTPYDVPTSVKNGWNDIYGHKTYDMRTGKNIVYDVYYNKYTKGGYQIVNKNFGNGSQPYINFQGWAINFGRQHHTSGNNETYIVAQKVGTTTTKIYSTLKLSLSASEDLEYNRSQSGSNDVWNRCTNSARNKSNIPTQDDGCNMEYDGIGFDAYLPLNELFPDPTKGDSWRLYIVKVVNGYIVHTELILPFDFDNLSYQGGDISLSSGVNANNLVMRSTTVVRRTSRTDTQPGSVRGYFTTGRTYVRTTQNESGTAIWYGVRSPHDNNNTRWSSSAYWSFGGDQAILKFVPDDVPPTHISHSLTGHTYKNGNDYWVQPNDEVTITLRQRDIDSGNDRGYIRLNGNNQDVRYYHNYSGTTTNRTAVGDGYKNTSSLAITGTNRTENTAQYGTIQWKAIPKTHAHSYDIMWYYRDKAMNTAGYGDTGMNLRVDGEVPILNSGSIGSQFTNGDIRWVKPNTTVNVRFRQHDPDSGNKYQYIRFLGNGVDVRSSHTFSGTDDNNNQFQTNSQMVIDSVTREQNTSYGTLLWKAVPKTHGHIYDVQYNFYDNVNNQTGYTSFGKLGVDGEAPVIQFRNRADNGNYTDQDWTSDIINVRLKFSDVHSGYKRSRFVWTQSTKTPTSSEWSSWTTSNNYVVSKESAGQWYLHVQAEDNLGNVTSTYNGQYKFNTPPELTMSYEPSDIYEGDTVKVCVFPYDADGHKMNVTIEQKSGNNYKVVISQSNVVNNQSVCYEFIAEMPGDYVFRGTVDDNIVTDSTKVEISFEAKPLTIIGAVKHTEKWERIHAAAGNPPVQFYSGEKFILEATTTDYPKEYVVAKFKAYQENDQLYQKTVTLNANKTTLHIGELFDQAFLESGTTLKQEIVTFTFEVKYTNGVIKQDPVDIQIIGDVFDSLQFHRKY